LHDKLLLLQVGYVTVPTRSGTAAKPAFPIQNVPLAATKAQSRHLVNPIAAASAPPPHTSSVAAHRNDK
jgi:hypothetical protein